MYRLGKRPSRNRLIRRTGRSLVSELLEPRLLLANDVPFQNPAQPFDVNRDLRITALDALQVINFFGRNGPDFVLPSVNDGVRFPDVNGSGKVTAVDALQVINRLPPRAPILAARLVSDSAAGGQQNLDFITNGYSLEFGVTHGDGSQQLEVRIDGSGDDSFVASGALSGSQPLLLSETQLDAIAGAALGDGDHRFEARVAGEELIQSFIVTIDKTAQPPTDLRLTSATDSGFSDSDGITNIEAPEVRGEAETGSLVTLLIDGEVAGQTTASSPWQASAGTLSEGVHTATATTEDIAGNVSDVSAPFQIEVDVTDPDEPSFDLDADFDTAPVGDQATHFRRVSLVGQTSGNVQVEILESGDTSTSDAGGAFQIDDVVLGLGENLLTSRATDAAGNVREFGSTLTLQNQVPLFDALDPLSVMPGDRLEVQLAATDPDGDSLTFSIDSDGPLPSGSLATGTLVFQPTPDDVGSYQFRLAASDGLESTPQTVSLDVVEDPVTGTRISGQILDTDSQPLEGVRVSIGDVDDFTAADGSFQLGFGRSALPGDTLRVHADELAGTNTFPFIAEKLPLLFGGREAIGGINNVISRPIFLPALDMANAVTIDPSQDMTVTTPLIDGLELRIAAGSLLDQQGDPFTGDLSITAVPPDLTPAALPEGSSPDLVVTIQPGDMVFTQPAPLDFPNTGGWAPGLMMNIMSINPVTGEFDDVGDAVVSADGSVIETVSGGVRNSSWHFPEPPPPPPHFPPHEPDDDEFDDYAVGSTVSASAGALTETHDLVSYQSQGESRSLTLTYDSLRADPRPIFHFDYDDVDPASIFSVPEALQVVARASVIVDGVEVVSDGFDNPGEFGLRGGENFFSIPAGSGPLDGALQIDLSDEPTGIYAKKMQVGLRGFTGTRFIGSSTVFGDEFLHVNTIDSPFGSGWGIEGLQEIIEGPDGSVAIIDGDGSSLRWEPGVRQVQDFLASNQGNESVQRFDGLTGAFREDFVMPGAGRLNNPHNPTFGADGNLYVVSDSGMASAQILRYDGTTGEFLDVFVDTGEGGYTGAAEQAFAPDGSLYLATAALFGVLHFDPFGNFIDSIAGPADGVQQACGIEFGADGLLYVWDTLDEEMRRFDPVTGDFVDVFIPAGNMQNACDFDFGTDGDIFITDLNFSQIRRFSGVDGSFVGVFSSTNPGVSGITFGPDGNFYANVGGNTHRFDGQTGEFIDEFVSGLGGFYNFFPPPAENINSEFISPGGDFSTLEKLPDGTFRRTLPDQTVFTFNAQNKLESLVDRNGNQTLYAYDVDGNVTSITDPVGLETTFAYDDGRVSTITDPAERETLLEYDASGNLTRITDPDGTSRRFQYDERHLMSGETDKRDNQEFDFYDEFGRLTRSTLADGAEIQITPRHVRGLYRPDQTADPSNAPIAFRGTVDSEYVDGNGNTLITVMDALGQRLSARDDVGPLTSIQRDRDTNLVTETTDARGNTVQFTYDDFGNLTSVIDSINSEVGASPRSFTYDAAYSQLTRVTDELGHQTLFSVDPANGNTLSITRVIGEVGGVDDVVTEFSYTDAGLIDTITDPLGRVTDRDYDPLGRLISETFAVGTSDAATRQFEYDTAGNQTAVIDAGGNRTELQYDELNRVTRIIEADPDGAGPLQSPVTRFTYDASGNVERTTDPRDNTMSFAYDGRNRLIRSIDAETNETEFQYDRVGNQVSTTDANSNQTRFIYDARNRLIETIDPDDGSTSFEYDADDNLTAVTDPVNNRTTFTYDARNRSTRRTGPIGNDSSFVYDAVDNLISLSDRNGRVTEYAYDDLNRLLTETWVGGGNVLQYSYDAAGNLATTTDNFSSLAFAYDDRDRLETADNLGTPNVPNVVLTYSYDEIGSLTSLSDTIAAVAAGTNTYQYDSLNRLTRLSQSGNNIGDKRVDFTYNPVEQYDTVVRFSDLAGTQAVVSSTYVYDTLNRLQSLSHDNTSSAAAFFSFVYDDASRITQITDVDGITTYAYDDRNQLIAADHDDAVNPDEKYAYDANGNRTDSHLHGDAYQTGPDNQLETDGIFDYSYDNEGNLIRRVEVATGIVREYSWDHRNRLTAVSDKDKVENEIARVNYTYDTLDRRISQSVSEAADTVLTHYVYDRDDVLLDFVDEDGATGPAAATLGQRYLRGAAVDQILAQDFGGGNVNWHLTNHLGTVTDLVDNGGIVINHFTYDTFGNVVDRSDPSVLTRYLYTGREFDPALDLYHYRARYYDPSIGRFISQDPLGFAAGDANLYRYVGNYVVNIVERLEASAL